MVDKDIYIQQLTYELRKAKRRNIELLSENARLKLQNSSLQSTQYKLKCIECIFYKDFEKQHLCTEYSQLVEPTDYCAWGIKTNT